MKTFGCLTMASNPANSGDKFNERGVPCVFLGYPQTQKGYKLLNLNTNMVFVSRDVRFYEGIYPYKLFQSPQKPTENAVDDMMHYDKHVVDTGPGVENAGEPVLTETENENNTEDDFNQGDQGGDLVEETQQQAEPVIRQSTRHHRPLYG